MHHQIIGEVGLSHEGSLGVAIRYVEALAEVGVSAVKFQMHIPEAESSRDEPFRNPVFKQDRSRHDYWSRTSFTIEEWGTLKESCSDNGIEFICTPFSTEAIDRLLELQVSTIKVGSGDFNNWEMLEHLRNFSGRLILSTGMATESEIIKVAELMSTRPAGNTTLMHCTSMYPTPSEDINLGYMESLRRLTGFEVGYSDHSGSLAVGLAALTLGAACLEAHVVFDKRQFGVDTASSLTVDEFEVLAGFANKKDALIAVGSKDETAAKLSETRQIFGRSLCLKANKGPGEVLEIGDFTMKKPGGGLTWEDRYRLVGLKLNSTVVSNDHLALKTVLDREG